MTQRFEYETLLPYTRRLTQDYDDALDMARTISGLYGGLIRPYHNIEHAVRVIEYCKLLGRDTPEFVAAGLFHDCVYIPGQSVTNELQSMILAQAHLNQLHDSDLKFQAQVCDLIWATGLSAAWTPTMQFTDDQAIFLDADHYELGCNWLTYQANGNRLRREFNHLTTEQWDAGRKSWLLGFMARPRIYLGTWPNAADQTRHELTARHNLALDLSSITGNQENWRDYYVPDTDPNTGQKE